MYHNHQYTFKTAANLAPWGICVGGRLQNKDIIFLENEEGEELWGGWLLTAQARAERVVPFLPYEDTLTLTFRPLLLPFPSFRYTSELKQAPACVNIIRASRLLRLSSTSKRSRACSVFEFCFSDRCLSSAASQHKVQHLPFSFLIF